MMRMAESVLRDADTSGSDPGLVQELQAIVGDKWVITEQTDMAPYLVDWRNIFRGNAVAVVRPRSTDEVSRVVQLCARRKIPVVPQGGRTGLVGGAIPNGEGTAVVLHLGRMNRIRDLDPLNYTTTVEAGCVLQDVQSAAEQAGRLFPLSFGAEGSCQIGGTIATNAGGARAMRYGTMRDLVLGLEVVLADGAVWNGLKRIRKDNTGYDLKHLFIGSEGTLGIVTAATLKLFPLAKEKVTALIAVPDANAAVDVLSRVREGSGDRVESCELMLRSGIDVAIRYVDEVRDPLQERYDCYLLIELATPRSGDNLQETIESILEATFESGSVLNAVIAANETQARDLWRLREAVVEGQRLEGPHLKHDICVPVSSIPSFLAAAESAVQGLNAELRVVAFGHLGDGNIHYNVTLPKEFAGDRGQELAECVSKAVYDVASELGGSISAEHGLGQLKHRDITRYKPALDFNLMTRVKTMLDPDRIMNPGKVLCDDPAK